MQHNLQKAIDDSILSKPHVKFRPIDLGREINPSDWTRMHKLNKDCCILGQIERERKEQEEKKTYKVAFEYVLESKRKAYEAVRQAGGGNIEHGLKIMQAMWDLEKTIYNQEP